MIDQHKVEQPTTVSALSVFITLSDLSAVFFGSHDAVFH